MSKILAPIRAFEEAVRVIAVGANEIYCGVRVPNIGRFEVKRMFNPTQEVSGYSELGKIIRYAHNREIDVIVTVNQPFISEKINKEIAKHFRACINEDVDAFLIGDLGVLSILKSIDKDVKFYASTYMITMNTETVEFLRKLGFSRVILDRQLSIKEMSYIIKNSKVDLEIFVHGGGCSNIDGSCYLFHYMFPGMTKYLSTSTNLYGNPCTLPYDIYDLESDDKLAENVPIMDAFEYCAMCKLPELIKLGVTGFKIEGRGSNILYKENTIRIYRELINLLEQGDLKAFKEKVEFLKNNFKPAPPSLATLNDMLCSQKRCYYPPLFHSPSKMPISWQSWTRLQFNTLVLLE